MWINKIIFEFNKHTISKKTTIQYAYELGDY